MTGRAAAAPHAHQSVLGTPGMSVLLTMSTLGFAGFSLLLPTAPLWAAHGGADETGAGLVNAVLMAATITAQAAVPWTLRRIGWRATLVGGMLLLGAPSLALALSDALPWVLACSAVRGAGFAVLTVCGSSAVAALVDPTRRGRAIGLYGLSIATPQALLVPTSAWVAESVDFRIVLVAGAAPVLAAPFALALGRRLDARHAEAGSTGAARATERRRDLSALAMPALVLLAVTTPGGALLTFAPQFPYSPAVVMVGLLGMMVASALSRWLVGGPADRHGARPFLPPLLALCAAGLAVCGWSVAVDTRAVAFVAGMTMVGIAYGSVQNLTLVAAFAAVPAGRRDTAAAVWNIGFDAGTGLGALAVGLVAARTSFTAGLLMGAAICLLVAVAAVVRTRGVRR
jgi:MFS family permease